MYEIVQNNNDPFVWLDELYQLIQDEIIPLNYPSNWSEPYDTSKLVEPPRMHHVIHGTKHTLSHVGFCKPDIDHARRR
jgi:hypothetical protein